MQECIQQHDHKSTNTSNQQQNSSKQTRTKQNWQKVRNLMKKYIKKQLIPSSQINHDSRYKLNLIQKQQHILSQQQYNTFLSQAQKQSDIVSLSLITNSQVVETINVVENQWRKQGEGKGEGEEDIGRRERIVVKSYRPVPRIDYLAEQERGIDRVDTTGAWVWEAEEVLAYFLVQQFEQYKGNRVMEIGAGCSGLAALAYIKKWLHYYQNSQHSPKLNCLITDGKQDNIIFLRQNISQLYKDLLVDTKNKSYSQQKQIKEHKQLKISVSGQQYLWGQALPKLNINSSQNQQQVSGQCFDLILAADCLFFQHFHTNLLKVLSLLVENTGVALFVGPSRGHSFDNFIKLISQQNNKQQSTHHYNTDTIQFTNPKYLSSLSLCKNSPTYNKDTDQPIFLQIKKLQKKFNDKN